MRQRPAARAGNGLRVLESADALRPANGAYTWRRNQQRLTRLHCLLTHAVVQCARAEAARCQRGASASCARRERCSAMAANNDVDVGLLTHVADFILDELSPNDSFAHDMKRRVRSARVSHVCIELARQASAYAAIKLRAVVACCCAIARAALAPALAACGVLNNTAFLVQSASQSGSSAQAPAEWMQSSRRVLRTKSIHLTEIWG